ncbi:MAG TPA: cytochrome C oxidase subunit IV family protein [Thermoanaerobaculia bacterium]|jgi:cytochrome c oxidase subunit 4|nr:cytochrome C oxidase subunit IV family protein [Thermoanaerobaculia bacterium]
MAAGEHKTPNYMAIFWWLAGFTAVEVAYSSLLPHSQKALLILGLVGFATIKASLVALYFMHLKFERRSLGIIVGSTLILGVILVSVGMAEHLLPRP